MICIYTSDYSDRYEISNAIAVQMSVYYNGIGKLVLDVSINDHNARAVKTGRVLYDTDRKIAYTIVNVKTDAEANKITANGFTTNQRLNRRVIAAPKAIGKVENDVYSLVNENMRDLENTFTAHAKNLIEQHNTTLYGGEMLDQIMPVLESVGLGNRMLWDHRYKRHIFEIYKGKDLTTGMYAVVFSDELGTATKLVINEDTSAFKNVAYVVAEYDGTELMEVVGTATGDNRNETWLKVSLSKEEGETEAHFRERMRTHGAMELGKLIKKSTFSVVIDPTDFGKLYSMGDLVLCVSRRFYVRFTARITGMKYKKDAKSEITELILSEPNLTEIGEVMLNG